MHGSLKLFPIFNTSYLKRKGAYSNPLTTSFLFKTMKVPWKWKSLSHVWVFVTPWTITVHGILQDRILEWVAFCFFRESSHPRDQTQVPCTAGGFFTSWAMWEPDPSHTLSQFLNFDLLFISLRRLSNQNFMIYKQKIFIWANLWHNWAFLVVQW